MKTLEELKEIEGIGEKVAESIHEWINQSNTEKLLIKLEKNGVKLTIEKSEKTDKLKGLTFVITGTLPTLSRDQAKDIIKKNGGKASSSVSKNTDYILAGSEAGSKLETAQRLEVKVIDEDKLIKMVK